MRDPMAELDNFTTPGLTMDPLPAAEVRRRGTRMRRRHNALATIGGVAAAAIIATPLALAANGGDGAGPQDPGVATQGPSRAASPDSSPDGPSPDGSVLTRIPASLDLGARMGDGSTRPREVTGRELADFSLELCGATVWTPDAATEVRSVELRNEGSEGGHQRTLAIYPGVRAAEQALALVADAVEQCRGVQPGPPAYEVLAGPEAESAATHYVQAFRDAAGLTGEGVVVSIQQQGNALLIDSATTMGAGDDGVRQEALANLRERDQPVLEALAPDAEG